MSISLRTFFVDTMCVKIREVTVLYFFNYNCYPLPLVDIFFIVYCFTYLLSLFQFSCKNDSLCKSDPSNKNIFVQMFLFVQKNTLRAYLTHPHNMTTIKLKGLKDLKVLKSSSLEYSISSQLLSKTLNN